MNQEYIIPNEWSILEEGFDAEKVKSSESLFSIGNGVMGQRANFEEQYTGVHFKEVILVAFIIQIKHVLDGGKTGIQSILQKF